MPIWRRPAIAGAAAALIALSAPAFGQTAPNTSDEELEEPIPPAVDDEPDSAEDIPGLLADKECQEDPDNPACDLSYADLEGEFLENVDFAYVTAESAVFRDSDLRGADFTGANLQQADLSGTDLRGARFDGADLTGATVEGALLFAETLEGATLCGTVLANGTTSDRDC
jgi:hypothetical protein